MTRPASRVCNTVPMATNQGFKSLIPKTDQLDAAFLAHWLSARTDYLQSLGSGATFKEISKAVVARIEIPLPPLHDQRRIAKTLDAADNLRELTKRQLSELDALCASLQHRAFSGEL